MRIIIFLSSIVFILCVLSCKKFHLEALAAKDAIWENRPPGKFCPPTSKPTTIENGELSFNANHLHCIKITMNPDDFEKMRNESRFGPPININNGTNARAAAYEYINACDVPFPSYYEWYKGNLTIDGHSASTIGLRKKGFLGSIFSSAPSIKINTAKYKANQPIGATPYITLNNNSEDPTRLIQCLLYRVFEWANYPSPRCNLATVSVNNEALGIYTHIEAIDRHFLVRNFGTSQGDLYEATLTDFNKKWLNRWEVKTSSTDPNKNKLRKIASILEKTPSADLVDALDDYINIDLFIRYWALEVLLDHFDGFTRNSNNLYVYFNPNDNNRAVFIPWGMNYYFEDEKHNPIKDYITSELPRRLSRNSTVKQRFEAEMEHLINDVWDENKLHQLIDQLQLQVKEGQDDLSYDYYVQDLKDWITYRPLYVQHVPLPRGDKFSKNRCHFQ